jgi:NDP-sugar pyrophosphorylase family protein
MTMGFLFWLFFLLAEVQMGIDYKLLDVLILVGGKGSRLRGIVSDRPKPMAEVAGRPFVEWLLLALRAQGVRRVVFCTGYMAEVIAAHFRDGEQWGMELLYSRDPVPLGTAGAVRYALRQVRSKDRFLVLNGDSYCRVDINRLEETHLAHGARASLWLVPVEDCRRYGLVEVGQDGAVLAFREKPSEKRAGLVNAGVYLLTRDVIESLPEGQPASIETDLFPRLIGHGLYAVVGAGPFLDIGTPESYTIAGQFFGPE